MATGTAVEVSGEVSGDYGGNGFFTRSNVATEANGVATKITQDAKPFDWPPKAARAKRRSRKQATRETPRWLVSRLRRFARGGPLRGPPVERLSVRLRCSVAAQKMILTLRRLFECDAIPECFKLFHRPADGAITVTASEVVGAELVIGDLVAHDVVRDFEHLMSHGDDRFLVPAMPLDAAVARLQCRARGARRGERAFDQRPAQKPVAVSGFPAASLPSRFVQAGTHRAPAT